MSALHSAQETGITSRRRELRAAPAEWRAQTRDEQLVDSTEEAAHAAPGEDGSPELVSPRAQWVYITVVLVLAALVLAGRVMGWLV